MSDGDPTPHTPWIREREPWVPEPTPTGRAILRLWIEEQLRLVAEARQRRRSHWHHGMEPNGRGPLSPNSREAQDE